MISKQRVAWMKRSVIQGFSGMVKRSSPYFAALHTGYLIRRQLSKHLFIHRNAWGIAIRVRNICVESKSI